YPDDPFLSFDQVKCKLEMLTGVVPIMHNMCINTCTVFTCQAHVHTHYCLRNSFYNSIYPVSYHLSV
ncbi:hypothetical protein L208DRAFT_1286619, partial [Tricholoma matsutake]